MKQVRILVSGRVQGVFFRVYTRDFAKRMVIGGYVRNLGDGRVEIVAEGSEDSLKALANWAKHEGSPYSDVTQTKEEWKDITKSQFQDFQITY